MPMVLEPLFDERQLNGSVLMLSRVRVADEP